MKQRGHTLLEILVVCGLVGLLMTTVMACYWMFNRSSRSQLSRIEARQQLRTSMAVLRAQLQSSRYIYAGYNGFFASRHYAVPNLSTGNTAAPGDLIFAMPQNEVATSMLWKICGMSVIPRNPPDPNNPTAMDLVVQVVENVGPAKFDDPSELTSSLASLGPASSRRFDAYIDANSYGIIVHPSPLSVFMKFSFKLRTTDITGSAPTESERYETEVFLRNQPPMAH